MEVKLYVYCAICKKDHAHKTVQYKNVLIISKCAYVREKINYNQSKCQTNMCNDISKAI